MSEAIPHDPVLQQFPEVKWDEEFGTLIVPATKAIEVAIWLRDDHAFRLDYCSNVTGIVTSIANSRRRSRMRRARRRRSFKDPARMEVVYHLYSMEKRTGPLVMKQRTTREKPGTVANPRLAKLRTAGAGDLRFVWHQFHRAPGSTPHPDVG